MVSFIQVFPLKPCIRRSSPPIPATCIILDSITQTIMGEQYRSLSSSLCSFLHSPVTSTLLGPNILLSTLFSNTLSLCSTLIVSDQVSHPHKTTGNIIVLYILVFKFLSSKIYGYTLYIFLLRNMLMKIIYMPSDFLEH